MVRPLFEGGLRHYGQLSVREERATALLKNEFGVDAQLCLDPTLLLTRQEWDFAVGKYGSCKLPNSPYVLIYIFEEKTTREQIRRECAEQGILCIDLLDPNDDYFVANQFDFINLIAHAKELRTNSFHGAVFALICATPFHYYPRNAAPELEERLRTLFAVFGLDFKVAKQGKRIAQTRALENIKRLDNEKSKSVAYLDNILHFVEMVCLLENPSLDVLKPKGNLDRD